MPYQFTITRRVEFPDTDMAGIMHFSNFFRFMEVTEHAFIRSLGTSVVMRDGDRSIGFPRVRATCTYRRPARFEDELSIQLLVRDIQPRRIRYAFTFHIVGRETDKPIAQGELEVACVVHTPDGGLTGIDLPDQLRRQLEVAPTDLIPTTAIEPQNT